MGFSGPGCLNLIGRTASGLRLYVPRAVALLKRPIGPHLIQTDRALCASLVRCSESLLDDDVLMPEGRRELREILGYIGWVQPGLKGGAVDGR